jgi:hypothetical protein
MGERGDRGLLLLRERRVLQGSEYRCVMSGLLNLLSHSSRSQALCQAQIWRRDAEELRLPTCSQVDAKLYPLVTAPDFGSGDAVPGAVVVAMGECSARLASRGGGALTETRDHDPSCKFAEQSCARTHQLTENGPRGQR